MIDAANIMTDTGKIIADAANVMKDEGNVMIGAGNVMIDAGTCEIIEDAANIMADTGEITAVAANITADAANVILDAGNIRDTLPKKKREASRIHFLGVSTSALLLLYETKILGCYICTIIQSNFKISLICYKSGFRYEASGSGEGESVCGCDREYLHYTTSKRSTTRTPTRSKEQSSPNEELKCMYGDS